MLPKRATWEDEREYEIDRVTDIRQTAVMHADGKRIDIQLSFEENSVIISLSEAPIR